MCGAQMDVGAKGSSTGGGQCRSSILSRVSATRWAWGGEGKAPSERPDHVFLSPTFPLPSFLLLPRDSFVPSLSLLCLSHFLSPSFLSSLFSTKINPPQRFSQTWESSLCLSRLRKKLLMKAGPVAVQTLKAERGGNAGPSSENLTLRSRIPAHPNGRRAGPAPRGPRRADCCVDRGRPAVRPRALSVIYEVSGYSDHKVGIERFLHFSCHERETI